MLWLEIWRSALRKIFAGIMAASMWSSWIFKNKLLTNLNSRSKSFGWENLLKYYWNINIYNHFIKHYRQIRQISFLWCRFPSIQLCLPQSSVWLLCPFQQTCNMEWCPCALELSTWWPTWPRHCSRDWWEEPGIGCERLSSENEYMIMWSSTNILSFDHFC